MTFLFNAALHKYPTQFMLDIRFCVYKSWKTPIENRFKNSILKNPLKVPAIEGYNLKYIYRDFSVLKITLSQLLYEKRILYEIFENNFQKQIPTVPADDDTLKLSGLHFLLGARYMR